MRQRLLDSLVNDEHAAQPSSTQWEQRTVDDAAAPRPTFGLRNSVLRSLPANTAVMDVQTALQQLLPGADIYHMPADRMAAAARSDEAADDSAAPSNGTHRAEQAGMKRSRPDQQQMAASECHAFVGNAAVHGDDYQWHVDADSMTVPESSEWCQTFGQYTNRVRCCLCCKAGVCSGAACCMLQHCHTFMGSTNEC